MRPVSKASLSYSALAALALAIVAGATGCVTLSAGQPGVNQSGVNPQASAAPQPNASEPTTPAALQAALVGEYAASFAYGVLGGQLPQTATHPASQTQTAARSALQIHNDLRDRLRTRLQELGATPGPPAAGYALPFPVHTPAQARELAATIELRMAALWDSAVIATSAAEKEWAQANAQSCRSRASAWSRPAKPTGR